MARGCLGSLERGSEGITLIKGTFSCRTYPSQNSKDERNEKAPCRAALGSLRRGSGRIIKGNFLPDLSLSKF